MATLVKAVSTTQASANLPSMTIPVSLHNVNISVSMPGQQKVGTAAGKQLTQLQRLQMQQMQKRATGTQQFATQQKVASKWTCSIWKYVIVDMTWPDFAM